MAEPKRIQRRRTKGWRMPEGAVYVGRPTKWGNPYRVGTRAMLSPLHNAQPITVRDARHAVHLYRRWLRGARVRIEDLGPELRGKDLACWCPLGQPCHADVLLEWANR